MAKFVGVKNEKREDDVRLTIDEDSGKITAEFRAGLSTGGVMSAVRCMVDASMEYIKKKGCDCPGCTEAIQLLEEIEEEFKDTYDEETVH